MTEVDDIREEEVLAKVEQKLKEKHATKDYTKNGFVLPYIGAQHTNAQAH